MKKILVVSPHADDESLGCGGTLLKHIDKGDQVYWLLITGMSIESGYSTQQIETRKKEIARVSKLYDFAGTFELNLVPARLDTIAKSDIVSSISTVIKEVLPEVIYTANRNDVHSDHEIVYDCLMSAAKSFHFPCIKKVLAYETLSETDFAVKPGSSVFCPNIFTNISKFLDKKLEILSVYESEIKDFPFPRSIKAISALARIRGVQANCEAAEAFMLIKEIN